MLVNLKHNRIKVTSHDAERLRALMLNSRDSKSNIHTWLKRLQLLLEGAQLVSSESVSSNIVTMNSKIKLEDKICKESINLTLVFPDIPLRESDKSFDEFNVSILSPIGLSVLGRKVGDMIAERVVISKMLYQPEASGDYDI